ncbi:MAG TPA: hypothetical protein VLK35_12280 [Methylomirabilota bacterium]|nr:hypothetical protein [Methylomirabilota bacterium]
MRWPRHAARGRASAVTTLLAVVTLVGLPVEITIGLFEHPVIAPPWAASLLLLGSCLLLLGSGIGLRRLEAARTAARPPAAGA